ncbi:hypothetical protein LINPERPRIM_LOCUS24788 [Linum perenne]
MILSTKPMKSFATVVLGPLVDYLTTLQPLVGNILGAETHQMGVDISLGLKTK